MAAGYAFVTLLTSDSYLPGALVLAKSIISTTTSYPIIVLVTENVSAKTCGVLKGVFHSVIKAATIRSKEYDNLKLLGRMELDVTYTKLHCFNSELFPYERVAFLDADTLVLQNIDSIFDFIDNDGTVFAAAPDVGWPDCFNSGVFVTKPSMDLHNDIIRAIEHSKSFDGGDQGLLNNYFSSWARESNPPRTARLPFVYNVTPSTLYSYLPAFKHFQSDLKIIHFFGNSKPWKWNRSLDGSISSLKSNDSSNQTLSLVALWWAIFDQYRVHELLSGLVLDRDWSQYKLPEKSVYKNDGYNTTQNQSSSSIRSQNQNIDLQADFAQFNVDWNQKELGSLKLERQSKLLFAATTTRRISKPKVISPNGIVFSVVKPALSSNSVNSNPTTIHSTNPHSTNPHSANPLSTNAQPVRSKVSPIAGVKTLRGLPIKDTQPKYPNDSFTNYNVGWNTEELRGKSVDVRDGSSDGEKMVDPLLKTDSFTISAQGVISYTD